MAGFLMDVRTLCINLAVRWIETLKLFLLFLSCSSPVPPQLLVDVEPLSSIKNDYVCMYVRPRYHVSPSRGVIPCPRQLLPLRLASSPHFLSLFAFNEEHVHEYKTISHGEVRSSYSQQVVAMYVQSNYRFLSVESRE